MSGRVCDNCGVHMLDESQPCPCYSQGKRYWDKKVEGKPLFAAQQMDDGRNDPGLDAALRKLYKLPNDDQLDDHFSTEMTGHCDCGELTKYLCSDLWKAPGLVLCNAPLCKLGCPEHRHQPGTMGYVAWRGATNYYGDTPDGPGLWEWLKSRVRSVFWPSKWQAQRAWDEIRRSFPPPAPYPFTQLAIGLRKFESRGDKMVEVEEWSVEFKPRGG